MKTHHINVLYTCLFHFFVLLASRVCSTRLFAALAIALFFFFLSPFFVIDWLTTIITIWNTKIPHNEIEAMVSMYHISYLDTPCDSRAEFPKKKKKNSIPHHFVSFFWRQKYPSITYNTYEYSWTVSILFYDSCTRLSHDEYTIYILRDYELPYLPCSFFLCMIPIAIIYVLLYLIDLVCYSGSSSTACKVEEFS